ncbi:hypothetical protein NIA15_10160, partial [Alistipes shahii]|nr:hypothetical protein [Alistipes shahii]
VKLELMSRFHNRNFELLEPYDAKVSRTVLRGEGSSNAPDLLDCLVAYILLVGMFLGVKLATYTVEYAIYKSKFIGNKER